MNGISRKVEDSGKSPPPHTHSQTFRRPLSHSADVEEVGDFFLLSSSIPNRPHWYFYAAPDKKLMEEGEDERDTYFIEGSPSP